MNPLFAMLDAFDNAPVPEAQAGRTYNETITEHVGFDSLDAFFRPSKQYAQILGTRRMLSTRGRANVWKSAINVPDMIFWARQSPAHAEAMLRVWGVVHDELARLGRGWEHFDPPIDVQWAQLIADLKTLLEGPHNAETTFAWIGRAKLLVINASSSIEEGWDAP